MLQGVCKVAIDPFDNPYLKPIFSGLSNWYVCQYVGSTEYGGYQFSGSLMAGLVGPKPLVQVINYYDNYDFMYRTDLSARDEFRYTHEEGFAATSSGAKGMLTGIAKLHTDAYDQYRNGEYGVDSPYNYSVMYYDDRGRLSQTVSDNHLGGMDRDFFSYDFNGNALRHLHRQTGAGNEILSDSYTYEYDHAERLVKALHRLGDAQEVILIDNVYDDLGRLSRKTFHNGLLNTSYSYNIRSWLTGITGSSFEQVLHYTDGTGIPYYNGNISSMVWKSGEDDIMRGYHFTYDNLNRLTNAVYGEGSVLVQNQNRFNEQVTGYDKMSNILGIKRSGQTSSTGYGLIDDLAMSYNGNQLKSVSDRATNSVYGNGFDFKDGVNKEAEYEYDENGNMTKDLNKKILNIQYNCLNLPSRIEFENGHVISYLYDADGIKLRTTHIIGSDTTVTDYCGNVIYENGIPVKLLTEAGYVTLADSKYHYFVQDHLGNNRVVVDQSGNVEEVNHYYPFGGLLSSSVSNAVQPYKYNGKELDRKNGLDWYDYGARMYDAALGRWHAVDPMSEKYYSWSPYTYCKNNPVLRIDLDGKDDYVISRSGRLFNETPIDKRGKGSTDNLYLSSDRSISVTVNQGLLGEMHSMQAKEQKENRVKKSYGSTQDLETAATVFKFAADHTTVEWKLDVYDDNGTRTAVVATDRDPYGVDNGVYAQNKLSVKGEKVIDIHSHLPGGTKGGTGNDFNLAKPQRKNAVYMKDNRVSTDKKGMIYEYIKNASRVNSIRVYDATDLLQYIKRK